MPIPYLRNMPWSQWTREERFFCAELFFRARQEPADFAGWLIKTTGLDLDPAGSWDIGYEVCFYRDFLWQQGGKTARQSKFPTKRTFDLCLFGEHALVIIEAKVCEPFAGTQNQMSFNRDKELIKSLSGFENLNIRMVALASSKYFANMGQHGRDGTLATFDGRLCWSQIAVKYPGNKVFAQADSMYRAKPLWPQGVGD